MYLQAIYDSNLISPGSPSARTSINTLDALISVSHIPSFLPPSLHPSLHPSLRPSGVSSAVPARQAADSTHKLAACQLLVTRSRLSILTCGRIV